VAELPDEGLDRLAVEYQLARSAVIIDARLVERWEAPEIAQQDELSRRHQWPADRAAHYLDDLRRAFRL
jgi:hypothetical protein